ncbi:MAG: hypothetical protein MPL62_15955, partial [Alphaproteobacteria bacterium]|nr:hypothetical protein [Alphaproteobacteria bacterium]
MKLKQLFGKIAVATALIFSFSATAHAQATGTADAYIVTVGGTGGVDTRLETFNVLDVTPDSNGDRLFSFDVLYVQDQASNGQLNIDIHVDSSKIEIMSVTDVNVVPAINPDQNSASYNTPLTYTDYALPANVGSAHVPHGLSGLAANTDTLIYPGWGALSGALAPQNEVTKMMQIQFKWLANAEGDSAIVVNSYGDAANIANYAARQTTVTGPEVAQRANLTLAYGSDGAGAGLPNDFKASAGRATQAQGAAGTAAEVTCNLTNIDGSAVVAPTGGSTCSVVGTAATLGGAAGSATHASSPSADTEYSGDDVTTAMEITIAAGSSSGTATFELMSNSTAATLQFDFSISAVGDHPLDGTAGDLVTDQFSKAGVTFRIVDAALQLVALGTDG